MTLTGQHCLAPDVVRRTRTFQTEWTLVLENASMVEVAPDHSLRVTYAAGEPLVTHVAAVSAEGSLVWDVIVPVTPYPNLSVGPDGAAYIAGSDAVAVVDALGAQRWTRTDLQLRTGVALDAQGALYAVSATDLLHLDAANGSILWRHPITVSRGDAVSLGFDALGGFTVVTTVDDGTMNAGAQRGYEPTAAHFAGVMEMQPDWEQRLGSPHWDVVNQARVVGGRAVACGLTWGELAGASQERAPRGHAWAALFGVP